MRTELLQKSADAQSSLKKSSAPTVPLRSRGMPRKMADTAPMRGIPSRLPLSGFRSPQPTTGPKPLSRTPAGKKEGGVKLLDITEQPLGYAAAKKRKRQQELEEQQRKTLEVQNQPSQNNSNSSVASLTSQAGTTAVVNVTTNKTPDYAAGLQASSTVYSQPTTPLPSSKPQNVQSSLKEAVSIVTSNNAQPPQVVIQEPIPNVATTIVSAVSPVNIVAQPSVPLSNVQIVRSTYNNTAISSTHQVVASTQQLIATPFSVAGPPPPSVEIVRKTVPAPTTFHAQSPSFPKIVSQSNILLTQKPIMSSQPQSSIPQPAAQPITSYTIVKQPIGSSQMRVVQVSSAQTSISVPTLTTTLPRPTQIIQQQNNSNQVPKIVQIKTAPTISHVGMVQHQPKTASNVPPLIQTQQQQMISSIHSIAHPQQQPNQTKYTQLVMSQSPNVKGKTIILTNPNILQGQKNLLLRSGNTVYQLGNVQGLNNLNLSGNASLMTPGILKTETQMSQFQPQNQQIPALVPTSNHQQQNIPSLTPVIFSNQQSKNIPTLITNLQPQQTTNHVNVVPQVATIIRPVGVNMMPQQLTLSVYFL